MSGKPNTLFRTRKRPRRAGFTLAEVMLAMVILTMMTLMFGAVFPMTIRAAQHANNYSQAALLAQRKIDQMRALGYNGLFDDPSQTALTKMARQKVATARNSDGTYDFTAVDSLQGGGGFFPGDTGGTITITDYSADATAQDPNTGLPGAGQVAVVTVTLKWGGTVPGSYTVSALIVGMTHA